MAPDPHSKPTPKPGLHPRNPHRFGYDFEELVGVDVRLKRFVKPNAHGNLSIDFANPEAVIALNRALLKQEYGVEEWSLPDGYLCPPVPGRADYVHHLADVLGTEWRKAYPKGKWIKGLDIGTGANLIYPLIGAKAYGWSFVGTDIDQTAVTNGNRILSANEDFKALIELRLQRDPRLFFKHVLQKGEQIDFTMCNPPFYASQAEAGNANKRKRRRLGQPRTETPNRNFGGQPAELVTEGGELTFLKGLIQESAYSGHQVYLFSTLVSKADYLPALEMELDKVRAENVRIVEMAQGQKKSRFISWTFLNLRQRKIWRDSRWK